MENVNSASRLGGDGAARSLTVPPPPALLVSLHDVSPLTLGACQRAYALLTAAGLQPHQLTLFVIPDHQGRAPLDQHPETVRWLRELGERGTGLVMHGLTHRMSGRAWSPLGFARAHLFARGQGEFLRCDESDARRRLAAGAAILNRAGLPQAARAFVPPAWLLSPAAVAAVEAAGFDFVERWSGIVAGGRRRLARQVIGWGSLSEWEARATALYAGAQSMLATVDTRLAVHPVDVDRPSQRRAVGRVLARLVPRMRPVGYRNYLGLR